MNAAQSLLFASHQYMIRLTVWRFRRRVPRCVQTSELESAALVGLWKAAQRFEPRRGVKFQTFAFSYVLGSVYEYLKTTDFGSQRVPRIWDARRLAWNEYEPDAQASASELFDHLASKLTPRSREIARLYFLDGLTMREISPLIGIDYTQIGRVIGQIRPAMRAAWRELA